MDMKEELALAALEWNYQYNSVRTRERQLLEALEEAEQRVYEIDTEEVLTSTTTALIIGRLDS